MLRAIGHVIRALAGAVAIAWIGMAALFALNYALTAVGQEHYRRVVDEAITAGVLAETFHQLLAPGRSFHLFGFNECLILGMLVMPPSPASGKQSRRVWRPLLSASPSRRAPTCCRRA